jgi:hypothetical protein
MRRGASTLCYIDGGEIVDHSPLVGCPSDQTGERSHGPKWLLKNNFQAFRSKTTRWSSQSHYLRIAK